MKDAPSGGVAVRESRFCGLYIALRDFDSADSTIARVGSAESVQPWKTSRERLSVLRTDGAEMLTEVPASFSIVQGASQETPST